MTETLKQPSSKQLSFDARISIAASSVVLMVLGGMALLKSSNPDLFAKLISSMASGGGNGGAPAEVLPVNEEPKKEENASDPLNEFQIDEPASGAVLELPTPYEANKVDPALIFQEEPKEVPEDEIHEDSEKWTIEDWTNIFSGKGPNPWREGRELDWSKHSSSENCQVFSKDTAMMAFNDIWELCKIGGCNVGDAYGNYHVMPPRSVAERLFNEGGLLFVANNSVVDDVDSFGEMINLTLARNMTTDELGDIIFYDWNAEGGKTNVGLKYYSIGFDKFPFADDIFLPPTTRVQGPDDKFYTLAEAQEMGLSDGSWLLIFVDDDSISRYQEN